MLDYIKGLLGFENKSLENKVTGYTVTPKGVDFHYSNLTNNSPQSIHGMDAFDLALAVKEGKVETGDILEVNAYQETKKYFYQSVDTFKPGTHHFWPEKPYVGMPQSIILGYAEITGWKKIGHYSMDQWNTMMREVNKQAQPQ